MKGGKDNTEMSRREINYIKCRVCTERVKMCIWQGNWFGRSLRGRIFPLLSFPCSFLIPLSLTVILLPLFSTLFFFDHDSSSFKFNSNTIRREEWLRILSTRWKGEKRWKKEEKKEEGRKEGSRTTFWMKECRPNIITRNETQTSTLITWNSNNNDIHSFLSLFLHNTLCWRTTFITGQRIEWEEKDRRERKERMRSRGERE